VISPDDVSFVSGGGPPCPIRLGGAVQIAKIGRLREKSANDSAWKRDLKHLQLPLALIALAMLGYVVIVWRWL
jgi:hypothetical protein